LLRGTVVPSFCRKKVGFFILAAVLFHAGGVLASEDAKQKYEEIQQEIRRQEEKLGESRRRESSVLGELDGIEKNLSALGRELSGQRRKLAKTNGEIAATEAEIAETGRRIDSHREWLRRKLQGMSRQGSADEVAMLLGADDMAGFLRKWRYLEVLARAEKKSFDEYRGALALLKEKEEKLSELKARLEREEAATRKTEARLSARKSDREVLLSSVRSEKASYQRMLEELREASEKLLSIIRRSEEEGGGYEGKGGKGFRALKGRLSWPVSGTVALSYGRQLDPAFKTPIFRNGIYIKTGPEAVARAVHDGKVVYADWFKGYGQLIIVNHGGGYHSLYANLSEIFLKVGDIIRKRTALGRVGESLMVNAPTLYFELRYKGRPLNPVQWLGRN
jgi:septal ring factor EnvC (AmiA/AmiB activator)